MPWRTKQRFDYGQSTCRCERCRRSLELSTGTDVTFFTKKSIATTCDDGDSSLYFPLNPKLLKQVCQVAPGLDREGPRVTKYWAKQMWSK